VTTGRNDVKTKRFERAGKNDKVDGRLQPSKKINHPDALSTKTRSMDSAEQRAIRGVYTALGGIYFTQSKEINTHNRTIAPHMPVSGQLHLDLKTN
jgi:hypothetical protein